MIVATGPGLMLLGLDAGNIERLQKGQPIRMTSKSHPGVPDGQTIVIVYGETQAAIVAELGSAIGPGKKVHGDPNS